MKRVVPIFLLIGAILALSSCKVSGPQVISSDGKSYEMITAEDGGRVTDDNGNLIVAATDADGNDVTEVLTEKYLIIDDGKLMAPAYDYEVPKEFKVESSEAADPLLVNENGKLQIHIMDKTKAVAEMGGYEKYVEKTYQSSVAVGIAVSEIENVTIADVPMQRFSMNLQDDDGSPMVGYGYFVKANNRILLITVAAVDGEITDVSQADAEVGKIDFINPEITE